MDESVSDRSITVARKSITIARVMLGVLVGALIISSAISSFSSDPYGGGTGSPLNYKIESFLSSIVLGVGLLTVILLLSVFASVYVEQLARRLPPPPPAPTQPLPNGLDVREPNSGPPDDSLWRR
jgi:hypothetical protein